MFIFLCLASLSFFDSAKRETHSTKVPYRTELNPYRKKTDSSGLQGR